MEFIILGCKLHSGTFKIKENRAGLVRVPLFWKSHCVTCVPAYLIPKHVTGLCKGPIDNEALSDCCFINSYNSQGTSPTVGDQVQVSLLP